MSTERPTRLRQDLNPEQSHHCIGDRCHRCATLHENLLLLSFLRDDVECRIKAPRARKICRKLPLYIGFSVLLMFGQVQRPRVTGGREHLPGYISFCLCSLVSYIQKACVLACVYTHPHTIASLLIFLWLLQHFCQCLG